MDAPDTAHKLDAEVVVAEVAHTMTNTKPSCSGGGESNRILNTFKEAMDLPQAARLKEAFDKDIASLENNVVFGLVQIASVPAGHKVVSIRWVLKLRRTVPTRVDSSCKDFGRSLASTAVAASFPQAPEYLHDARNRGGAGLRGAHAVPADGKSSTSMSKGTCSSRWHPTTKPTTKQEFLSS